MTYANKVINDIERGASGKIWWSLNAASIKFGLAFFPTSWLDSMVAKGTGLDALTKTS